jgi:hypothetical protein
MRKTFKNPTDRTVSDYIVNRSDAPNSERLSTTQVDAHGLTIVSFNCRTGPGDRLFPVRTSVTLTKADAKVLRKRLNEFIKGTRVDFTE